VPYHLRWSANVVLAVLAVLEGIIAAMKAVGAADLAISPAALNWALVLNAGCVALAAALPQLGKTPAEHEAQQAALGKRRATD
jgi:hypothetical protein